MPDDARAIDNMLLMAHMAGHPMMRACLPGLPIGFHDVATAAERWLIFNIDVEAIASICEADDQHGGGSQERDDQLRHQD